VTESHRRPWRPSRLQVITASIIGGLVIVVGLAVALTLATGPVVPRGTTVSGVDIGGLGRDAAIEKVRADVARPAAEPLEFDNAGEVLIVKPRQAGVWVNAQETVEPLLRTSWNPVARFLESGGEVAPVVVIEEDELERQMGAFDRLVTTQPSDPQLSVRGTTVTYVPGQQGRTIDRDAVREAIINSITEPRVTRELPVIIDEPFVTVANAEAANAFAVAAVSGPVNVVVGDVVAEIPADVIGNALTFSAIDGDYVPELDGAALYASIADEITVTEEPRDAGFRVTKNGTLRIVPSVAGGGVSDDDLAARVLSVLGQDVSDGGSRDVAVPEGERQPEFTTADAEALGITEKLSSFTQRFEYAAYRVTNIGQAAEYVNGTILMPGDTFSMNDTIKERTVENGYTEGIIIGPGGVFEEALGGGVSAATTAVWTAAFFAGMERVDTRAHSVYISRYQPGLEATVAWGIFDMKFRNDSPYPVLITTKMTNSSMAVEFWGTRVYDAIEAEFGPRTSVREPATIYRKKKNGCSPQRGIPGFSINVDRVFFQDEQEVKRETISTAYRAAPNVVCGKDPKKDKKDDESSADAPSGDSPTPDVVIDDPEVFENVPAQEVPVQ
jgi:vancomycin resistance protein YoaR